MNDAFTSMETGRTKDACGKLAPLFDPVKVCKQSLSSPVPDTTLEDIVEEILPHYKKLKSRLFPYVISGLLFVFGSNIIYYRYFDTWIGSDTFETVFYIIQVIVLLVSLFILIFRSQRKYARGVISAMLKYQYCPHCGTNLKPLSPNPVDGTTTCSECDSSWLIVG